MPKDKIPYWDFNAPDLPDAPRDASAAAVAASGLLELSRYVSSDKKEAYFSFAAEVLQSLSGPGYFIFSPTEQSSLTPESQSGSATALQFVCIELHILAKQLRNVFLCTI